MAKFFKPRRGNLAMATSLLKGDNRLKAGEMFFECPDEGIGKGTGKIKMGDGVTDYEDLPYFLVQNEDIDVSTSPITFEESTSSAYETLLGEIVTGNALNVIIGASKKLFRKLYGDVTQLNNDREQLIKVADFTGGYPVLDFGTFVEE